MRQFNLELMRFVFRWAKYNKNLIVIFLMVFVFSFLPTSFIFASNENPTQADLQGAQAIESGGSYSGGTISEGGGKFYKIAVKPGEELKIFGNFKNSGESVLCKVYTKFFRIDGKQIAGDSNIVSIPGGDKVNLFFLPGNNSDSANYPDNMVYYQVFVSKSTLGSYSFNVQIDRDKKDVGSETDAPEGFSGALEVESGDYKDNFIGKNEKCRIYCSSDLMDTYKVNLNKGETLKVMITPADSLEPHLSLFNHRRQLTIIDRAQNPGQIVEAEFTAIDDAEAYIQITGPSYASEYFGRYDMSISVTQAETAEIDLYEEGESDYFYEDEEFYEDDLYPDDLEYGGTEEFDDEFDDVVDGTGSVDYDIPQDVKDVQKTIKWFTGGFLAIFITLVIIGIATFVFWVMMFIDAIKRDFPDENHKILWALVIFFTGFIGAVIYYFVVKRKDNENDTLQGGLPPQQPPTVK